jgi:hypothetical protein
MGVVKCVKPVQRSASVLQQCHSKERQEPMQEPMLNAMQASSSCSTTVFITASSCSSRCLHAHQQQQGPTLTERVQGQPQLFCQSPMHMLYTWGMQLLIS